MSDHKRIPFASHLATRDSTLTHDGELRNVYEEDTPIGKMVVKRPGQTSNVALGSCLAQGSTFFNNNNYFVCSNTLYLNPPTSAFSCPVPGAVTYFGDSHQNTFAIIDPVTGLLWASTQGGTHTVNVYNITTGALVTTISIPAASGDAQGIFYCSPIRKMITVSTAAAVGVADYFVINPDTYNLDQSIILFSGGAITPTTVCLDNATTKIVVYNSHPIGGGGNGDVDYLTNAVSSSNPYPIIGTPINDFVYAKDLSIFALIAPGLVSLVANINSSLSATNFTFNNDTAIVPVAYDSKRHYFWVFERGLQNLYYIPVTRLAIGAKTLFVSLPANPMQVTYDPYRDVLWATFEDATFKKISPITGQVLASYGGATTSHNAQFIGTRLLFKDACTLIQNSGTFGLSFTVLGIQ